jgi:diguanylate cyclase (GGDEF)-like protein/PAS domain S-box-containing protein
MATWGRGIFKMPTALVNLMDCAAAAFDGRSCAVEQMNDAWAKTPELIELSGSDRLTLSSETIEQALLPVKALSIRLHERIRDAVNLGSQTLSVMIAIDGVARPHQIKLVAIARDNQPMRGSRSPIVLAWLSAALPSERTDGDRADMSAALSRFGSLIGEPWAYVDAKGIYQYVSPQALAVLGPDGANGVVGSHYAEWAVDHPGRSVGVEAIGRALQGETLAYDRLRFDHRFGEDRWHSVEMRPDRSSSGELLGVFIVSKDAHARKAAEMQARNAQNLLDLHMRTGPLLAIELDRELRVISWSHKAEELLGFAEYEVRGKTVREIGLVTDIDMVEKHLLGLFASQDTHAWRMRNPNRTRNGEMVWIEWFNSVVRDSVSGNATLLSLGIDVTPELELKQQLTVVATQDPLTGALNRKALTLTMSRKLQTGHPFALVLLDLDSFKQVNDYRGHPTGDQLLVTLANRLREMLRPGERLARLGGDEFAILIDANVEESDATLLERARIVLKHVSAPVNIDFEFTVTASIGIARSHEVAGNVDTLFRNADLAMYRAKALGGGRAVVYVPEIGEEVRKRLEMCESLRKTVRENALDVHYQPIFDTATDRIVGAEALARWKMGGEDYIDPPVFVGLAEEKGFIHELWQCVMRKACLFSASVNRVGDPQPCTISVNVSPLQLSDRRFDQYVLNILRETRCLPGWIAIEVTESAQLGQNDAITTLRKLTGMGVRCSVDDFGTGFSNFGHLRQLPLATLKVDKSFVRDLAVGDTSIVKSIVIMAEALGLKVVAEGVEFVEELLALKEMGCHLYQGFVASAPIPGHEFATMLRGDRQALHDTGVYARTATGR